MAEPFAGDHWGAGFDEEVKDGWSDSDGESRSDDSERGGRSETSGSADDEVLVTPLKSRSSPLSDLDRARLDAERRLRVAEDQLREFAKGRYWVEGGEVVQRHKGELYGWKTVSTGELQNGVLHQWRSLMEGLSAISLGHTLQPDWKQLKVGASCIRTSSLGADWVSQRSERANLKGDLGSAIPARATLCLVWPSGHHARFRCRRGLLRESFWSVPLTTRSKQIIPMCGNTRLPLSLAFYIPFETCALKYLESDGTLRPPCRQQGPHRRPLNRRPVE